MAELWAAEWYSKNKLDGEIRYIIHDSRLPALFRTRQECRVFIKEKYGFIATREDLKQEPHGWRMPKPVRVKIELIQQI